MSTNSQTDINGSGRDLVGFPPIREEYESMETEKSGDDVVELTTKDGHQSNDTAAENEEDDRIGEDVNFSHMTDTLDRFAHFTIRKQTSYR